jgi:hypothetical protein
LKCRYITEINGAFNSGKNNTNNKIKEAAMHKNGAYIVKKDDPVVLEGKCAASVNLLLRGRLNAYITSLSNELPDTFDLIRSRSYKLFSIEQNIFLGVNDIFQNGTGTLTLVASCDSNLYAYEADNTQNFLSIIHSQKDYGSYAVGSLCSLITSSAKALERIGRYNRRLLNLINSLTAFYLTIAREYQFSNVPEAIAEYGSVSDTIRKNNILIPNYFDEHFFEIEIPCDPDKEETRFAQAEKRRNISSE